MVASPPRSDNANGRSMERPLAGAVLCCTSISPEDRTLLAEYAEQMGAEHKLDLTSDVTHLLVGSTDTLKYQYVAKEREDVKVLRPEWVQAVRERWMEDRPLDMNALEAEYRVATLAGLKICFTGFDDLTFRAQLQRNVILNGGEYTGDLTKDVTHLIAARPEGKKYEYATLWQRKVVSLQWYKDTLDRGMQLDESTYHPTRPAEEQGLGAWIRQDRKESFIGKRTRDEQAALEPARKLRRTASAKLGSQADNMWGDIVGQTTNHDATDRNVLRGSKSMLTMREDERLPEHNNQNTPNTDAAKANVESGFLSGLHFASLMFEHKKKTLIDRTLEGVGARVVSSVDDLFTTNAATNRLYVIVPHQTKSSMIPGFRKIVQKLTIVTELWLERCMLQKSLIPLAEYPLGGIIAEVVAPELCKYIVNATGFPSIETLHISKMVAAIGATYNEVFTPVSTVLICNSMNINKQKLFHAQQWKIPAVSENWLCKLLREGSIPPFENYLIQSDEAENDDLHAELRQRRLKRNPREPQDKDDESQSGNNVGSMFAYSSSTVSASASKQKSSSKESKHQETAPREHEQNRQQNRRSVESQDTALQEMSPNSLSRRNRLKSSPGKKSLFKTYDGTSLGLGKQLETSRPQADIGLHRMKSPQKPVHDATSINSAIQDLLDMKAKAKANVSVHYSDTKGKKERLLSRALSNLSNASRGSRQSRASSVDSLNTDGLGSEIGPPSGRLNRADENVAESRKPTLQSRAPSGPSSAAPAKSESVTAPLDPSDSYFLRDEFEGEDEGQQLSQVGYEDSEEAIALRERLAAKRRAASRVGQNPNDPEPEIDGEEREALKQKRRQKQVIKDDDILQAIGWGGGRRTRAKNRSADMSDWEML